jgi:hypothetical protein
MKDSRRLVLLELNEVNFDVASKYVDRLGLSNFARLFESGIRRTSSESRYEQLEPWIQWVSAHSGLTAAEHGIFRLGDIVGSKVPQLFEYLEAKGLRIGAVSPMNAENRLERPAFFFPDPWTQTACDESVWSRILTKAIAQAVNDNSESRITFRSVAALSAGLVKFARPHHYPRYAKLALASRGAPWRKALFLDLFLNDMHCRLLRKQRPDFSTLFLNAGAHIQHHYLLNSYAVDSKGPRNPEWYVSPAEDPVAEMLKVYDEILGDYLSDPHINLIVATGLTQQPYPHATFYWRLKNHDAFLRAVGLRPSAVIPRMTRDFLVEFDSAENARQAERILGALKASTDGVNLFEMIDNRGTSLFVTLTYPHEVSSDMVVIGGGASLHLQDHLVFVAIKNGMHAPHGYICCHGDIARYAPPDGSHVKHIHSTIVQFFT